MARALLLRLVTQADLGISVIISVGGIMQNAAMLPKMEAMRTCQIPPTICLMLLLMATTRPVNGFLRQILSMERRMSRALQ